MLQNLIRFCTPQGGSMSFMFLLCMMFKLLCLQECGCARADIIKTQHTNLPHIKQRQEEAQDIKWLHSSWAKKLLMLEIESCTYRVVLSLFQRYFKDTLRLHPAAGVLSPHRKALYFPTGKHIACKCPVYSACFSLHELARAYCRRNVRSFSELQSVKTCAYFDFPTDTQMLLFSIAFSNILHLNVSISSRLL